MQKTEIHQLFQKIYGDNQAEWERLVCEQRAGRIDIYQELEMRNRFVDAQRDTSLLVESIQLHSHTFYEIIFCYHGNIQYLLGHNRYRIGRGDIIIIPPEVSHRPLLPPDMPHTYDRYVVWLSEDFVKSLTRQWKLPAKILISTPILLRITGTHWDFLEQLFINVIEEDRQRKPGWEVAVIGHTLHLLVELHRAATEMREPTPPAEKPELLDQVLVYIEKHLADHITLPDTARRFSVSESTISQMFRRRMNDSFYRCVTQRRLIEAKARIAAGDVLDEVAQAVGFSDYSAFYRAFKREYGISPIQYRQLLTRA